MDMPEEPRNAFPALYESSSDENAEMENYKNTEVGSILITHSDTHTVTQHCSSYWTKQNLKPSVRHRGLPVDSPAISVAGGMGTSRSSRANDDLFPNVPTSMDRST